MRFSVAGCSDGVDVDAVGVGAPAGVSADEGPGVDTDTDDPDACAWPGGSALLGFGVPVGGAFCG